MVIFVLAGNQLPGVPLIENNSDAPDEEESTQNSIEDTGVV